MKINALQAHKIATALNNATSVLHEIKAKPLKGKSLEQMKTLEAAVQNLEWFHLETR